ncbi:sulfatase family protein [Coraliomargarita parva]|uniref:sulfatase family protein n=1 Tax=Coraliomargarita parva TaxID=3014050 RepID=UPI0022B2D884|nr:sulfatase-like hydrolase/transferase [Coraliomargarita parva]
MNILFLMTDQLRYDCVSYLPGSKVETPNIDRIAQGHAFTRCQTVNPICQPARTALLTGKYPHQIGTLSMSGDLSLDHPTCPQALQKAGYWTAGIGKFHYLQTWHWDRPRGQGVDFTALKKEMQQLGYDHVWETAGKQLALKNYCDYCVYLEEQGLLEAYRDFVQASGLNRNFPDAELAKDGNPWPFDEAHHVDRVTGRKIREAISERPKDKPFYIYGSFCSPHKPFDPPQRLLDQIPYEEEDDFIPGERSLSAEQKKDLWKLRRAYKATIRLIDEEVGMILDQLESEGILEDTLILFSSDHGEMMGDHFRVQKSDYHQGSLNVPFAIRHPKYLNAGYNDSPVELTDVTATILDAAGLAPKEALSKAWPQHNNKVPCRSLLPVLSGESHSIREYAFSECAGDWSSITSSKFKYVRLHTSKDPDQPSEALYDTENDPHEQQDLSADPDYTETLAWHRRRWIHVMEKTPPAQHTWAPLIGS